MIKGRPCKIVEMSTSKTGKHGHAKVHMITIDIFTGKKLEDICPSTHNMEVPNIKRVDYQFLDIDDNGDTVDHLKLPEDDIGTEIKTKHEAGDSFMVTVLKAVGEEKIVGTKTMT